MSCDEIKKWILDVKNQNITENEEVLMALALFMKQPGFLEMIVSEFRKIAMNKISTLTEDKNNENNLVGEVININENTLQVNLIGQIKENTFAVKIKDCDIKLSNEHKEYKWVEYDEAMEKLKYDSNKTALWELNERLKRENLERKIISWI